MTMIVLITGFTGQDGAWLAKFLLDRGYEVWGVYRRLSTPNFWRLQALGIIEKVKLIQADITDSACNKAYISLTYRGAVHVRKNIKEI